MFCDRLSRKKRNRIGRKPNKPWCVLVVSRKAHKNQHWFVFVIVPCGCISVCLCLCLYCRFCISVRANEPNRFALISVDIDKIYQHKTFFKDRTQTKEEDVKNKWNLFAGFLKNQRFVQKITNRRRLINEFITGEKRTESEQQQQQRKTAMQERALVQYTHTPNEQTTEKKTCRIIRIEEREREFMDSRKE